jgi:ATP-dependent DNA helicase DinG
MVDQWPGLVDIRGMGNYECVAASPGGEFYDKSDTSFGQRSVTMCDEAPCTAGIQCGRRGGGCTYFDARRTAEASQLVITNYSYWMHIHKYGDGLGKFDMLILDEAHDAPEELASFVSVTLTSADMVLIKGDPYLLDPSNDMQHWKDQAGYWLGTVSLRIEVLQEDIKERRSTYQRVSRADMNELRKLKTVEGKLAQLASASGEWVLEYRSGRNGRREVQFDPIWPQAYSEQYLFLNIPKVVLSSATIRPKTLEILGIPDEAAEFREYPSTFPVERRPVIHVTTAAMSMKANDAQRAEWHSRMDQIIRWRQDRKGIIHTVSYDRAQKIAAESEFRHMMMLNDSASTRDTVREFKERQDPCILVSPSVTTGYDFPYEECEYVIISKVPVPATDLRHHQGEDGARSLL